MRRSLVLVLLAVLALAPACSTKKPAMSAEDARTFTQRALSRVGFRNGAVDPNPTRSLYKSPDPKFQSDPAVDVWQTRARVPDGEIELFIQRDGDSAVFVRDTRTAGGRLLTEAQFVALEKFRLNPADDRRRADQRNVAAAGVALVVVVAISLFATVLTGAADRRERRHSARAGRHR